MKYKLIIIMIFVGLGNLQAQSNATLEETINWLNEHSLTNQIPASLTDRITFTKKLGFDEKSNKITFYTYIVNEDGEEYFDGYNPINYHEIRVRPEANESYKGYLLWFILKLSNGKEYSGPQIRYYDKDLALRSLKAFEHLFKLLGHDIKVENKLADKNTF